MLKNRILLAVFALFCSAAVMAQKPIEIDNAKLNPAPFSYSAGGTVAVPVKLNSCFFANNDFQAVVLDASNNAVSASFTVHRFYITFMNIDLPQSLASGNYKVAITSNSPVAGDTSALFPVVASGTPLLANAVPVFSDHILLEQYYYGICDGLCITSMSLTDSSSTGGVDSLELRDDYHAGNPTTKYIPNGSGKFNLNFNPISIGAKYRDAYYTAFVKTINGGKVATKAYHIINNSWDIATSVLAKAPGTQYSCKGDTVALYIKPNQDENLQQNFPGALIRVVWEPGAINTIDYTQCQILSSNGVIKHAYNSSACQAAGKTSFEITSTVRNPFNILNGPGITGTCQAGAKAVSYAYVFSPPVASFRVDSAVCVLDTVKFKNLSNPGQGPAAAGNIDICANLANYTWMIDSVYTPAPLYQTPFGKVENPKDTAYAFPSFGLHKITLVVNNNYGSQAPCPSDDTTRIICVDTAKVRPDFQLDSAGVLKDSLIGCAPVFCIKNNTRRTFCIDSTQFKYYWRVLDATTPGPNHTPAVQGIDYVFTSGNDTSRQPCISINKTGKYYIELMASATCKLDSSLAMRKYVEANGDAGVNFAPGLDTVYYCGAPVILTINYSPSAPANPQLFGSPVDSVSYTYQASTAGALKFKWTITPGSSPADWQFVSGTSDTSRYPAIQFKTEGLYKVVDSFTNNCQPKAATQYVAYRKAVAGSATSATDTICYGNNYTVNGFNILASSGAVGSVTWGYTGGTGNTSTFSPSSGSPITPNILTPTFSVSPQDLAIAQSSGLLLTIRMTLRSPDPSKCTVSSTTKNLYIRPEVAFNDTAFNRCSGSLVGYQITKPGLAGANMSWTYTVLAGSAPVSGMSNGSGTIISDILSLAPGSTSIAVVKYHVTVSIGSCTGTPFDVYDTVRPIPAAPIITLISPSNATQSMCSYDTANIQMVSNGGATDMFSWTSHDRLGFISGLTTGTAKPSPIINTLGNTNPQPDTATYIISVTSAYGCTGPADSTFVIVTPGPPKAQVVNALVYVCNNLCDSLKANSPGPSSIGNGTWTITSYSGQGGSTPAPVIGNPSDSATSVCNLKVGQSYNFLWTISPVLAGCPATSSAMNIQVVDSVTTPIAPNDTSICDFDRASPLSRSFTLYGKSSRVVLGTEQIKWSVVSKPAGSTATITPTNASQPTFIFNALGDYVIEMRIRNFVCTDKVDTMVVHVFGKPSDGTPIPLTISPQMPVCQGTTVSLTCNVDTQVAYVAYWRFNPTGGGPATFEGQGLNTYVRPGSLNQQNANLQAIAYSKGWNFGCKDSAKSVSDIILIDSPSVAGTIVASDTVVCNSSSVVALSVINSRGKASKVWLQSTASAAGPYTPGYIGPVYNITGLTSTTWVRAIVTNGKCGPDTTAPVRLYMPSGADAAKTGNDTSVCGATCFMLSGNIPVVGTGVWELLQAPIPAPNGCFTFGVSPNDTTSQNPVNTNISAYGTYSFIWKVKNLSCDASADTITIINTEPISNNNIGAPTDTVCKGTAVAVTGGVPLGGSGTFIYIWERSTDGGATWHPVSNNANTYNFPGDSSCLIRRTIQSNACISYSNTISIEVLPTILNNTISPASSSVCINTPAPNITGSTPTGGNGVFTYSWDTANIANYHNGLWASTGTTGQNYNPGVNLTDSFVIRRIVYSSKCVDISDTIIIAVNPDAKASFTYGATTSCAPFPLPISPAPLSLITNYTWYADTTGGPRFTLGTGAGFPGYTITKGLDSVKITLMATSTQGCLPDSMIKTFYTSATPVAQFTVSVDSGCANNTGVNTTTFNFNNTTPNTSLFSYVFDYGDGNSPSLVGPGYQPLPHNYAASTTGLDTIYNVCISAISPACGTSKMCKNINIRTLPKVSFSASPTYQCSGGIVNFTNSTIGSPNLAWDWSFGDGSANANTLNTSHTYNVASLTTETVTLKASNECGVDSAKNYVVIAANTVALNLSVKGSDKFGCLPHTVTVYSNSTGGTSYQFDMGDGIGASPAFTNGTDSFTYTYNTSGRHIITLTGSTTCGTVSKTDSAFSYGKPAASFVISPNTTVCKGDSVQFTTSGGASHYFWKFGDNTNSGLANPKHPYGAIGTYTVKLFVDSVHTLPLGGTLTCADSSAPQNVTVRDTMPATFTITPVGTSCLPYTVTFNNTTPISTLPITTLNWSFGIPGQTSTANPVNYTYQQIGQYNVNLTVTNAGGCTYIDSQKVNVAGPVGSWTHDTGYVCSATPVNFQITAASTDTVFINYGDATPVVAQPFATLTNPFTHVYAVGGTYYPTCTLKDNKGCTYFLNAFGAVRVDYVKPSYTYTVNNATCGSATININNTSTWDQTAAPPVYDWNINGVSYNVANPVAPFTATGTYNIRYTLTSVSGCFDSVITTPVYVKVNDIPVITSITRKDSACTANTLYYSAVVAPGGDPIQTYNWYFGNGLTAQGQNVQTTYATAGVYRDTLQVITSQGCPSVRYVSAPLLVSQSPTVTISPANDTTICMSTPLLLNAFGPGIVSYTWQPTGTTGSSLTVSPTLPTKYTVTGIDAANCKASASITVSSIPDFNPKIIALPDSNFCRGDSIQISIINAPANATITWNLSKPYVDTNAGFSVNVKSTLPAPTLLTAHIVDSANCYPKDRSINVGIGDTLHVNVGLDSVYLQNGTTYTFTPSFGGQIPAHILWTPGADLNYDTIAQPTLTVTHNECYQIAAETEYHCKDTAKICVIAFCENSQVFIPNAFTPGQNTNGRFYVTATGIDKVLSFRIFNRWGQVVFERSNYTPDPYKTNLPNILTSWDGSFKGAIAPTDVYVYTCEVRCFNGTKFVYTGNVALIK